MNSYLEQLEDIGANLIVYKDDKVIYCSDKRGVSPLIDVIQQVGIDELKDVVTADRIVGKAAVLLNVYMGSKMAHAMVMSKAAVDTANKFGLEHTTRELVEYIVNRDNTGMCPFEQLVAEMDNPNIAYNAVKKKLEEMKQ